MYSLTKFKCLHSSKVGPVPQQQSRVFHDSGALIKSSQHTLSWHILCAWSPDSWYKGGFITFVAVCRAIFGFPILIVRLFNFLCQNMNQIKDHCQTNLWQKNCKSNCRYTGGKWEYIMFPCTLQWSQVLGVLQQTHIDAVEVDTPVGSSPGGNEAIAMLARGGQGGAGGCQSSHCSYSFLHREREDKAFIDRRPNTNRPWPVIWKLENKRKII